jgi:hypothetical protein
LGRSNDASASSRTTKTGAQKIDSIYDLTDGLNLLGLHLGSIETFLSSIEEHPKSNHIKLLRENIVLVKKSLNEQVTHQEGSQQYERVEASRECSF